MVCQCFDNHVSPEIVPAEVYLSSSHFLSGSHMDLCNNRPSSSWPDKLHSQRPFPSLGKKVCILFCSLTVTNTSRGVGRLSSPWTTLKPKTTSRNVYILRTCFPFFNLQYLHTLKSALQQKERGSMNGADSGLWFVGIYNKVSLETKTSAETIVRLFSF